MTGETTSEGGATALKGVLLPLALAQFICSFAGSNMNVMINDMSEDLDTTVQGIQLAITIFLLVMAALMIPCGKLTDRYGRKRCFNVGLAVYAVGALLSAAAPGLGILIRGNSMPVPRPSPWASRPGRRRGGLRAATPRCRPTLWGWAPAED